MGAPPRHTCLTGLREAGTVLEAVQAGHTSIDPPRIYLHLADDWLAAHDAPLPATDRLHPATW